MTPATKTYDINDQADLTAATAAALALAQADALTLGGTEVSEPEVTFAGYRHNGTAWAPAWTFQVRIEG